MSEIATDTTSSGLPPALKLSLRTQLAMVAMGYIPFLNVIIVFTLASLPWWAGTRWWLGLSSLAWLLLAPPLVVRAMQMVWPLSRGDVAVGSAAFLRWWFATQWQVIFNRLPWIEEMVRLAPGLYSAWLRLWGSRIGRFVYWTPGLRILDRPLVAIGDQVVFGAGVKINPHIILPDPGGRLVLRLGAVRIGDRAMVGGYAILLAGVWIAPGEATPGDRTLRPFSGWENGKPVRPPAPYDSAGAIQR